nr:MAG TPA: hypothetical protein [Caudoviricetes sp.]
MIRPVPSCPLYIKPVLPVINWPDFRKTGL